MNTGRETQRERERGSAMVIAVLVMAILTLLGGGLLPVADARTAIVTLTPLVVLLFVFWLADLLRGGMERLVLRPPE